MKSVQSSLENGLFFGTLAGGIAASATFGGRYSSKFPQLPHINALGAAGAFGTAVALSTLAHDNRWGSLSLVHRLLAGMTLATAVNKLWINKKLSIISAATTPAITAVGLWILFAEHRV